MYSVSTLARYVSHQILIKCRQYPATLGLLAVIWAVEIVTRFIADSKADFNAMMGIQFSQPFTYFSYAFVQRDMAHIVGNSIVILIGMPIESSYGKRVFCLVVVAAIFAGALGALVFNLWSHEINEEPIIGASAIGRAFVVAGVSAIIQGGVSSKPAIRLGNVSSWMGDAVKWALLITIMSGLYFYFYSNATHFVMSLILGIIVGVLLALGIVILKAGLQQCKNWEHLQGDNSRWRMVASIIRWAFPVSLFGTLIYMEVTGYDEWFYGNSGHAGGALVGLIISYWLMWRESTRRVQKHH